ncbi:MAG: TetR/AcrR family transcriptional regulator [Moraxellaceae bacterium]|nr:TetR/AcrR family transcriptional regulator [Moraxellaceae bacterium]
MTNKFPDPGTPPLRRRGRPGRDTAPMAREELVRRAFTAFARDGFESVTLRQLAAECGVSDSLLSHHFGSKQQLWEEAADSVFAPLLAELVTLLETLTTGQDLGQALRSNLREALRLMATRPDAIAFMFREGEGDNERGQYLRTRYVDPYIRRMDTLFAQAQAQGRLRRVAPAARHALVMGLMRMLAIPGVLRDQLAPYRCDPQALGSMIDDVVVILFDGQLQVPSPAAASTLLVSPLVVPADS